LIFFSLIKIINNLNIYEKNYQKSYLCFFIIKKNLKAQIFSSKYLNYAKQ